MWTNLLAGLPYLFALVAGTLICLLAGPKDPASRTWRVPAVVGFGLLTLQHLVQTAQTMALFTGVGSGPYYRSGWFVVIGFLASLLTLVGVVLIAVAVVRGRGAAVTAVGVGSTPTGPGRAG